MKEEEINGTPSPNPEKPSDVEYQPMEGYETGKRPFFKHPFAFEGRICRMEYLLSLIIYIGVEWLLNLIFLALVYIFSASNHDVIYLLFRLFEFGAAWFLLAQGCKRCHDLDHAGWWQLIPFYPLWLMFKDGVLGDNEFGSNPKGLSAPEEDWIDPQSCAPEGECPQKTSPEGVCDNI